MTQWTVYIRAECSLCDALLGELAQMLGPIEAARVRVLEVDAQPDLQRKYGLRVPVLLADGEFVCAYRLDAQRVRAYLGRTPPAAI